VIGDQTAPFLHGFTAGGHPAACAVALANIEILEDEELIANAERVGGLLRERLQALSVELALGEVRGLGLLCAIDLGNGGGADSPASGSAGIGARAEAHAREAGMLVRRYGDTVILAPALVATEADVEEIVERLDAATRRALADDRGT
jgi:4-aminobutyrate---pyruvate transaminase